MDDHPQITPPTSPPRLYRFPTTPGSPEPVPSSPEQDDIERELEHGPHGAQGGDDGNKYQVMWMTLACINALYQPETLPKLAEIILEGKREPFDDIEIRKPAGKLTLFQSKHRNKTGSNNITVAELVKDPDGKKDAAPFSLLKYFRGMMKLISNDDSLVNANFIVCVSAPFSTIFTLDNTRVTLPQNFWETTGFQDLPQGNLEPLLSNIFYRDHDQNESLAAHQTKQKDTAPRYVRFSDRFINGQITGDGKKLRDYLYNSLVNFIKDQRKKKDSWVNWPVNEDNNKIKFFFENFQLWLQQPKLEILQKVVSNVLRANFGLGVEDIQYSLTKAFEQSANRATQSLLERDIERYFRCARGSILTRYLGVVADQFRGKFLLDHFPDDMTDPNLRTFLQSPNKVCLLTSVNYKRLKYIAYCTARLHYQGRKTFQEHWFIVDGLSKPLFHIGEVEKQFIDHSPEDILAFQATELIIIDLADCYLSNIQAQQVLKKMLSRLQQNDNVKLVLIAEKGKVTDWKRFFESVPTPFKYINIAKPTMSDAQITTVIKHPDVIKQGVDFFDNQFLSFTQIVKRVYPSLFSALANPNTLVDVLKEGKLPEPRAAVQPAAHELTCYQPSPIPLFKPVYRLRDICGLRSEANISIILNKADLGEQLKQITSCEWKYDGKNKYFLTENSKTKKELVLVLDDATDLEQVLIQASDPSIDANIAVLQPARFKQGSTTIDPQQLLIRSSVPQRSLLAADYGSGKSTLLKYLLHIWQTAGIQGCYEWILLIKFPSVIKRIRNKEKLIDVLAYQAKKNGMVKNALKPWQKLVLQEAITSGRLLLLADGWDELKGEDIKLVNEWLGALSKDVGLIICTRPHAEASIAVPLTKKMSLNPFTWQNIQKYITDYFKYTCKTQAERHQAFLKKIFTWLGNGKNEDALEVLQRPLHIALLCQALDSHYRRFMEAKDTEAAEAVSQQAPWNDPALYRTKLYQLIAIEQFRKYLSGPVGVQAELYKTECWRISLLTQPLQIRLREIGFHKIFGEKPIKIVHVFDEKKLDKELDDLGFITHHGEAEHRIFLEYFAAEYLLFGLTRDADDFYYKHVIEIIRTKHSDKKYEQVWRILGEMIRHGNEFLNVVPIGVDTDLFEKMPAQFDDGDVVTAHRRFFRSCLNGQYYKLDDDLSTLSRKRWFIADEEDEVEQDEAESPYQQQTPRKLLEKAKSNKNVAADIVKYLVKTDQLSESWLESFYLTKPAGIAIEPTLASLHRLIDIGAWPEQAWGGYWDVDVFLPSLCHMTKKLYVVAAAYFIHRIENKRGVYYSNGVPHSVTRILTALAPVAYENSSNLIFLMMIQQWLRELYVLRQQAPATIIPDILRKAWQCFKNDRTRAWLGVDVMFSIAFVFRLPIIIKENAFEIQVPHIAAFAALKFEFANASEKNYFMDRVKRLHSKSNFQQMTLPDVEWTGPEKPASAAQLVAAIGSPTHSPVAKDPPKKTTGTDPKASPTPKK